ncbi:MAG: histidine--tRNA ligase [Chloroflexota bacterium]
MPAFRAPRGTSDILPEDQPYWAFVAEAGARVASRFGYRRIETPTFEPTRLFERGVGDETDIVQKEMYTFEDHAGESLTLRPEGTASVCRSYIQHGMRNLPQPVRLFYDGPMFRYERPQAGRFRQFHQFGVEAIGDPSPEIDAEIIEMGWMFLQELGISDITLRINSLGDPDDRDPYSAALGEYYSQHLESLPKEAQDRLKRAPLRLLDSKDPRLQELAGDAPRSLDYMGEESRAHWERLLSLLDGLKPVYPDLNYVVDHRLVRGLDYYNRTVFEIEPRDAGGQSTLLAGGRYDPLVEILGGDPAPGIGFAAGLERLILGLKEQETPIPETPPIDVVVVRPGDTERERAAQAAAALRARGLSVVVAPARSMRAQLRYADSLSAQYALILGDRELERGKATLKPLDGSGEQSEVALDPAAICEAVTHH